MKLIFLLCVPGLARLSLTKQSPGGLGGAASVRRWYICRGQASAAPTPEQVAAGIEVAQDLSCTREFTFKQLCCADFGMFDEYLKPDGVGPYFGQRSITLSTKAGQQTVSTSGFSLVNDAAGLDNQLTLRLCTSQYATAAVTNGGSGGPTLVTGQLCDNEEFLPADLNDGQLVLDTRIRFLEKQGLPGSAIPVCHEQFQGGEQCPAESARTLNGKPGFNSASAAELNRIGKPLPPAALVRIEDELARLPENAPLKRADAEGELGLEREHRSQVKTLKGLGGMQPEQVTSLLGGRLDVALKAGSVLRLKVANVTQGDAMDIAGTLDGEEAEVKISKSHAELRAKRKGKALSERLGLEDVVLSSLGRSQGAGMSEGTFAEAYYGEYYTCGHAEGYYFPCDEACGEEGYYHPCDCEPPNYPGKCAPADASAPCPPPAPPAPAPPPEPPPPKALDLKGAPVSQSSFGWGGSPERAVDGNMASNYGHQSCTHTHPDNLPWWQVQLPQATAITAVEVTNRWDCCSERLNGIEIFVNGVKCAGPENGWGAGETRRIPCQATGSVVKIQNTRRDYLTLCEVVVVGSPAVGGAAPAAPSPAAAWAGEYEVFYRGGKRGTNLVIRCDGTAEQPGIFTDRLRFDAPSLTKCAGHQGATVAIENTHGAGKYECLVPTGSNLKGWHYDAPGRVWGDVEYRRFRTDTC